MRKGPSGAPVPELGTKTRTGLDDSRPSLDDAGVPPGATEAVAGQITMSDLSTERGVKLFCESALSRCLEFMRTGQDEPLEDTLHEVRHWTLQAHTADKDPGQGDARESSIAGTCRRARAEFFATLVVRSADLGLIARAEQFLSDVEEATANHLDDPSLQSALARSLANIVAVRCHDRRLDDAEKAYERLADLGRRKDASRRSRRCVCSGAFTLIAHSARDGHIDEAIQRYRALGCYVDRHRGSQEAQQDLADVAFALITTLGEVKALDQAANVYRDLGHRNAAGGEPGLCGRQALAGFNLLTDYCQIGAIDDAYRIYEDLATLSVAHPEVREIGLAQAKGGVNIILSLEPGERGDLSSLLRNDLRHLAIHHADDPEICDTLALIRDGT